jgi:hypothetical protein
MTDRPESPWSELLALTAFALIMGFVLGMLFAWPSQSDCIDTCIGWIRGAATAICEEDPYSSFCGIAKKP